MRKLGIRNRLLFLVALVIIPMLLLSVIAAKRLADAERASVRQQLIWDAVSTRNALDVELRLFISVARALSSSQALAAKDFATFRREAELSVKDFDGLSVLVSNPDGQQLINTVIPSGEPLPRRTQDAVAAQTQAFEAKHPVISDAFLGAYLKIPIVTIEVPVFRDDAPHYAVAIVIDVRHFLPLLAAAELPTGWLGGIIDRRGNFIARSQDHDNRVLRPASEGFRSTRATEGVFEFRSLEGTPIVSANAVSQVSGWAVSMAASQEQLDTPVSRSLKEIAAAGTALLTLSLGLAAWIARGITKPINVLNTAAPIEQVTRTGLPEVDDAIKARASAERKLSAAIRSAELGVHVWYIESGKLDWDARVHELWGVDPEVTPTYETFAAGVHSDDREAVDAAIQGALDPNGEGVYLAEFRVRPLDGSDERWVRATGLVVFDDGTARQLIGTVRDVSQRKKYEQKLELLNKELAHRGKNLLGIISAIATQALPEGGGKEAFIGRLQSLSRAYSALIASSWDGVDLTTLVRDELRIFSEHIEISGPNVKLCAQAAQMLALAIHELATNATKYGALSVPEGHVSIGWSITEEGQGRCFSFSWIERGGPPVVTPQSKGFGTTLTDKALGLEFATKPKHEYNTAGVRYSFETNLEYLTRRGRTSVR